MNNIKFILAIASYILVTSGIFAQDGFVFLYPNNNDDIGFGFYQDCNEQLSYVVNGPLYGKDGKPVGGYVVREQLYRATTKEYYEIGRQVKNWVDPVDYGGNFKEDNGIFGLTMSGDMILQRYENWIQKPKNLLWGFQNGMILLLEGTNLHGKSSQSKYVRSGVGYRDDGSLVVAISKTPINFYELGEVLRNQGCRNAIYLDGSMVAVGYCSPKASYGFDPDAIKIQFYH